MQTARENAFLLTREWRDRPDGIELVFWARGESGPIRIQLDAQEAVAFVERDRLSGSVPRSRRRRVELRTLEGAFVDALYFKNRRDLVAQRKWLQERGLRLYESDVKPTDRFLMERFVTGALSVDGPSVDHRGYRAYSNPRVSSTSYRPELSVLSLDIETGGTDDAIYSICGSMGSRAHVFLLRSPGWEKRLQVDRVEHVELSVHRDEARLLEEFFSFLATADPDAIIGWNVIDFDLSLLERRCRDLDLPFAIGRARDPAAILAPSSPGGRSVARVPGRVVIDGIDALRTATWSFEDFGLDAVASELLGRGKLIEGGRDRLEEIRRLYREAPWDLVRYNAEDCRLVEAIFERTKLLSFLLERSQLTGLALDRVGGSVAAFDNLYLPRLHRKGRVARDVEERPEDVESPGGFVLESEPGLFENVLVLDFKSLYPSIIRTFLVDPLGLSEAGSESDSVPGFRGASFSRERHILPGLIEEVWQARDRARAAGNEATSRAIKILMNSFYGVLGTPGCRFFEPRLASSVTLRGHEIIRQSKEWIEREGRRVIYGDTDSLFVLVGAGPGAEECRRYGVELARRLNRLWAEEISRSYRLESHLELEFETHYLRFFMPTIRGSEVGSKKRYAGLTLRGDSQVLEFTGLEAVRSDWTPLAREFQREIYRRVFFDEPFEDYVKKTAAELFSGTRDSELVYRKRLRRRIEDYRKGVPPHAQAALKRQGRGRQERHDRWIRYVVTTGGPEPVESHTSPLDYQHYLDRQLAPAADALLRVKGTSVAEILDAQLRLF